MQGYARSAFANQTLNRAGGVKVRSSCPAPAEMLEVTAPTEIFQVSDGSSLAKNYLRLNENLLLFWAQQVIVIRKQNIFFEQKQCKIYLTYLNYKNVNISFNSRNAFFNLFVRKPNACYTLHLISHANLTEI